MELAEKAAYIKGLVDGLELDPADKQTKVIKALVSLVNEMAEAIGELEQSYDDVCDQIDALDEDLAGVEDLLFEDYEDDDDSVCDYCLADSESDMAYEVTCPTCGSTIGLSDDKLGLGEMTCPNCGQSLEFDYDEDELDGEDEE